MNTQIFQTAEIYLCRLDHQQGGTNNPLPESKCVK